MRQLLLMVVCLAGCNLVAPFETRWAPDAGSGDDADTPRPEGDISDEDDASADADAESDADTDDCVPICGDGKCGFDGCGGFCRPDACGPDLVCGEGGECVAPGPLQWLLLVPGTFTMGAPDGEIGQQDGDHLETQHLVTLTHAFLIQSTEVTQDEYENVAGRNPSFHLTTVEGEECTHCPVESVSWFDAAAYCNALSDAAGLERCFSMNAELAGLDLDPRWGSPYECPGYRLPTEAEFEYATRAGTTTATYVGDLEAAYADCDIAQPIDTIAWTACNAGDAIYPVGSLDPNAWGLYDMLGHVFEWCHDWREPYTAEAVTDPYGPSNPEPLLEAWRVSRGSGVSLGRRRARAAYRLSAAPGYVNGVAGFRAVRTASP